MALRLRLFCARTTRKNPSLREPPSGITAPPYTAGTTLHRYLLPEGVDANAAAGFELNYGTVWHGLVDCCELAEGETLLVLGASGGVGMAAVDIGQALGCTVIACASTLDKLDACKAAGAHELINYESGDFKALLKESGYYGSIDVSCGAFITRMEEYHVLPGYSPPLHSDITPGTCLGDPHRLYLIL